MVPKTKSDRLETVRPQAAVADDPARVAPPWDATDGEGLESPARRLQLELHLSWAPTEEPRWSPRRTLAFVVITNGLFWVGLIWAMSRLA